MALHSNWRDCQAWTKFGTPLSTTSNEACKMFDATLTQYVGWFDNQSEGGIESTCEKMITADPNFVMGHVLKNGLDVMGTGRSVRLDNDFVKDLDAMAALSEKQKVTPREKKHVEAVKIWAEGDMYKANDIWEDILVEYPLDILALKFAHDSYFYLGQGTQMRDSLGRCLPFWDKDMPLYGYLIGMHSFGLEETNLYPEAEKAARKGLEINPKDAWSTHTMAHVMEMMCRSQEGMGFMSNTEKEWASCGMLACHNYWHWALYNMENGMYDDCLGIVDKEIISRGLKSGAMLDLVDCCSILFRLEMEGQNIGGRWNDVFETCRPHIDDHILSFNDNHFLLACLGAKQKEVTDQMMESLKEFVKNGKGDNRDIMEEVGMAICEGFKAYNEGDFAKAVDVLYPVRYKVVKIGGSHAQRDMYSQFLIQAALKSPLKKHHQIARFLLMERKALKPNSPLTDRLIARVRAIHAD